MPGTVIGTAMNCGFPGTYARNADCIISNRVVKSATITFGDGVILNTDNTVDKFGAGCAMASFLGVAVRTVKSFTTFDPAPTEGSYLVGQPCDVIERGSVSVKCCVGTPVAGGAVYLRITANSGIVGATVGGFEYRADDDSGKCILITNAKWTTGYMDANNICELTLLTRNLP